MKRLTCLTTFLFGFLFVQSASAVLMTSTINFSPSAGSFVTFQWDDSMLDDCGDGLYPDSCIVTDLSWTDPLGMTWNDPAKVTNLNIDFSVGGDIALWQVQLTNDQTTTGPCPIDICGDDLQDPVYKVGLEHGAALSPTLQFAELRIHGIVCGEGSCESIVEPVDSASAVTTVQTTGVPEPTTLALMGLGLAGVGWTRRKRTQ